MRSNSTRMLIKVITSVVVVIGVLFIGVRLFSTESAKRELKTFISDRTGGIHRTLTVYDYNGNSIKEWSGKFDVQRDDTGVIFDLNGKRIQIQGGITIIEEN